MEGRGRAGAIPHVSALDGGRGAAVAGVLLFHGGHLLGGYLGVDFFFVLSGFLITSLLLAESKRTGSVGLGGFWARRARRLLPALCVMLVFVAWYAAMLAKPEELAQIRGDALATLGYVANWRSITAGVDYWALFRAPSPLQHTWSLAIEEQFYLVWPLVFVGLLARWKRNTPKVVLAVSLVLAVASSVTMVLLYAPDTARAYYGTDTRAAAILFGAALAAALAEYGPVRRRTARLALEVVGVAGAIVLGIAWTRLSGQSSTLYHGGFVVCGLAATAVIAAAVHPEPGLIARALSFRPLCALGLISYGVYLYHWPIDVVLDTNRVHLSGWPLFLVQTAVTLAAAIASYFVIEQPIRHGALSAVQWRALVPVAAAILVVLVFGTTNGARQPAAAAGAAPVDVPKAMIYTAEIARQHAPVGSRRVLIVGNSVAALLAPGFRAVHAQPPLTVFDAGIVGCNFPDTVLERRPPDLPPGPPVAPPCHPSWEAQVVAHFRPDVVIWIVSDPFRDLSYRGQAVQPCAQPYDSLYENGLRKEIARLSASGAHVVLTTAAYARYTTRPHSDRATDCDNALRRKVARQTGTQLVDLFQYMCPHGECRTKQDGVVLRPDGQHYEGAGGKIVAQWLVDQLR